MINERQNQIKEHLAKSSGREIKSQRSSQNRSSPNNSSVLSSSKTSLREHLQRSMGNCNLNASNKQVQKSRILEHIRITKG